MSGKIFLYQAFYKIFIAKFIILLSVFSTFGVGMLKLLLEYCQSECVPGFSAEGDLPAIAWDFHQDLSFVFLVFSPRNKSKYGSAHPHYLQAYENMSQNKMLHQFCTQCDDVTCIVNATMLRIIYVCMHYLDAVSYFFCHVYS